MTIKPVSVIWVASSDLYLLIMKTLLCIKISTFDQTSISLKTFWFLANHLDSKKKKKEEERFSQIYLYN